METEDLWKQIGSVGLKTARLCSTEATGRAGAVPRIDCARHRCSLVAAAVNLTRARLASFANVQVAQQWLPQDWAVGGYDLIVIGEFGFYLSAEELGALIQQAKASLQSGGTLVS